VSHVATLLWVCLLGEYASNDPTTPEERFALGYIYMEVEPAAPVSAEWLAGLVAVLRDHSGWGIGITNVHAGVCGPDHGYRSCVRGVPGCRCGAAIAPLQLVLTWLTLPPVGIPHREKYERRFRELRVTFDLEETTWHELVATARVVFRDCPYLTLKT